MAASWESALFAVCASCLVAGAHAGAPACAATGKVPDGVFLQPADPSTSGLTMLAWTPGQKLEVRTVHTVTGECQGSVTGFTGSSLFFKGGLAARLDEAGALQAARAAPRLPSLPSMNDEQHEHDEEDGHTHSDSGLGEFVAGARVAVKATPQGNTEFFVGAWSKRSGAHTIAMFARNPQGILSPPAALMRSERPIRGLSYTPGPEPTQGVLGVTLDGAGEARLIQVDWTHRDFTQ